MPDAAKPESDSRFVATSPDFTVPENACDCHVHLFGPHDRYPLAEPRAYTPLVAQRDDLRRMHRVLGVSRTVLVQPSVYGSDNRLLVDSLQAMEGRARGIAVVEPLVESGLLDQLDRAGVRGLRCNIAVLGGNCETDLGAVFERAARTASRYGWHVQIHVGAQLLAPLVPLVETSPVDVVLDHFAGIRIDTPAFAKAVESAKRMLASGKLWIKLSAPDRAAPDAPHSPLLADLARQFVAENPERLLWGSDWPHTPKHAGIGKSPLNPLPFRRLDTGALFRLLAVWIPDPETRCRVLVHNPERLYGFLAN